MEWKDEIVEDVRAARKAYAEQFGFDIERMMEDLKAAEATHPERIVERGESGCEG
jgi:hypothetical protein